MELGTLFRLILFNFLLFVVRGYLSNSPHIITFWGQDPALQEAEKVERALNKTCGTKSSYSTVVLGFVSKSVRNKTTASLPPMHCVKSAKSRSKLSLYCPEISKKVELCKNNKKKVLIGVGGPNETLYFDDPKSAQYFAKKIWNWFLGGTEISDMRPFGGISLDGVNIFLKDDKSKHVDVFLQTLDKLRKRSLDNKYVYTMSVPCNAPEAYFGEGRNKLSMEKIVPIVKQIYVRYSGKQCCKTGPKHFRGELQNWKKFSVNKDRPALFVLFPRSPHKTMTNCFSSNRQLNILHNMMKYKDHLTGLITSFIARKRYKAITHNTKNYNKKTNNKYNRSKSASKSASKRHLHPPSVLKRHPRLNSLSNRLKKPLMTFLSSLNLKQSLLSSVSSSHHAFNATNITMVDSPLSLLNNNIAKFRKKIKKHPVNVSSVLHLLRGNKTMPSHEVSAPNDESDDDMHIQEFHNEASPNQPRMSQDDVSSKPSVTKIKVKNDDMHIQEFHNKASPSQPRVNQDDVSSTPPVSKIKVKDHSKLLQEFRSMQSELTMADDGGNEAQVEKKRKKNATSTSPTSMHVAENKAAEKVVSDSQNATSNSLIDVGGIQTRNDTSGELNSLSEKVMEMWGMNDTSTLPEDSPANQIRHYASSAPNISESIGYILGGGVHKQKTNPTNSKNSKKTKNHGNKSKKVIKTQDVKCSPNDTKSCNTYKIYGAKGSLISNTTSNNTNDKGKKSPQSIQFSNDIENVGKMKSHKDLSTISTNSVDKSNQLRNSTSFDISLKDSSENIKGKRDSLIKNGIDTKNERKTPNAADSHLKPVKSKDRKVKSKNKSPKQAKKRTTPMSIRKHIISNISQMIHNVLRYQSMQRLHKANGDKNVSKNTSKKSHSPDHNRDNGHKK